MFYATYLIGRSNAKDFASGLIFPGDLPDDKIRGNSQVVSLFQATCPMVKIHRHIYIFFRNGLIAMGDLSRKKKGKGLIIMGDLPK